MTQPGDGRGVWPPLPPPRRRLGPRVLAGVLGLLVLAGLAAAVLWHTALGGRWQVVATPSMGTAAPVGTLVLTVPADRVAVGDIVTYHPPVANHPNSVTHRVISVEPDGGFRTRGDINGAVDPWTVRPSNLVGVASYVLLASTGLLPIRATAATGGHVDLRDGEVGLLTTQLPPGAKGAVVTTGVHMPIWLWVVMTLVWLVPMFYGLVAAWRRPIDDDVPPDDPGAAAERPADADPITEPILIPGLSDRPVWMLRRAVPPAVTVLVVVAFTATLALGTAATTASFTARVANTTNTAASAPFFTCASALTTIAPAYLAWPLDDTTVANGSTARDVSGNSRPGQYVNGFTSSTSTPCARDTARSVTLTPTAAAPSQVATSSILPAAGLSVFSLAIWVRTTTTTGGKLMGWGTARTGASLSFDRHLYMTDAGRIVFGVYPSSYRTVTSPRSYNDGQWHLVVATLSGAGMVLYVDGAQVVTDPATTTAGVGVLNLGYWRVGYDNLVNWPNRPTTDYWAGSAYGAAVYGSALSPTQVAQLYSAAS